MRFNQQQQAGIARYLFEPITILELCGDDRPRGGEATRGEAAWSRTAEKLEEIGIRTIEDLLCWSEADLRRVKGFGQNTLDNIRRRLSRLYLVEGW